METILNSIYLKSVYRTLVYAYAWHGNYFFVDILVALFSQVFFFSVFLIEQNKTFAIHIGLGLEWRSEIRPDHDSEPIPDPKPNPNTKLNDVTAFFVEWKKTELWRGYGGTGDEVYQT